MAKRYHKKAPVRGNKALEMQMRDALDGLHDSASYFAFQSVPHSLEILSIEPPKGDTVGNGERVLAPVYRVPPRHAERSQDIVEYLMAREERSYPRLA